MHGIARALVLNWPETRDGCRRTQRLIDRAVFGDEAGTGSMGELTPITEVDGRTLMNKAGTAVTQELLKCLGFRSEPGGQFVTCSKPQENQ